LGVDGKLWFVMLTALLISNSVFAMDPLDVSISPLWNGYVRSGLTSAAEFDFQVREGGMITLRLKSQEAVIETKFQVESSSRLQRYVPFLVGKSGQIEVQILFNSDIVKQELLPLTALNPAQKLIAVSGSLPAHSIDSPKPYVTAVFDMLPQDFQGYAAVDALVISEQDSFLFSPDYWQSISQFVAVCRPLYWLGGGSQQLEYLMSYAGCNGQSIKTVANLPAALADMEHQPVTQQLPGMAELLRIDQATGRNRLTINESPLWHIGLFLLLFLFLLLVASRHRRSYLAVLFIVVSFAGLVFALWLNRSPLIRISSWAEMSVGDKHAHYVAAIQVTGQGQGDYEITLPLELGLPIPEHFYQAYQYLQNASQGSAWVMNISGHLLSQHSFQAEGLLPITAPLVEVSANPQVLLTNRDSKPLTGLRLVAEGHNYALPSLAPGEQWSMPEKSQEWGAEQQDRLLRRRVSGDEIGILIPYSLADAGIIGHRVNSAGWLLVHTAWPGNILPDTEER